MLQFQAMLLLQAMLRFVTVQRKLPIRHANTCLSGWYIRPCVTVGICFTGSPSSFTESALGKLPDESKVTSHLRSRPSCPGKCLNQAAFHGI